MKKNGTSASESRRSARSGYLYIRRCYELTSFDGSHSRKRNDKQTNYQQTNSQYIFTWLINYLRSDAFGGSSVSINQNVENWAKTRFSSDVDPLTDEEITRLRSLLITAPSVGTY